MCDSASSTATTRPHFQSSSPPMATSHSLKSGQPIQAQRSFHFLSPRALVLLATQHLGSRHPVASSNQPWRPNSHAWISNQIDRPTPQIQACESTFLILHKKERWFFRKKEHSCFPRM